MLRLLQSSFSNSFIVAGLTADGSPAVVAAADELVALGLGEALAFGVALALPLALAAGVAAACRMNALVLADGEAVAFGVAWVPVALGLGVGVAEVAGVDEPSSSTGRNRSCAVVLTSLITSCEPLPGTVTVMSLAPWRCTETPVLPEEFTRLVMIETACCISASGAALPCGVTAARVACVPLDRSSPSWILKSWCHFPGLNAFAPTMPISMTTISATRHASARPGREPVFLGGATCPVVLQSVPAKPARCRRGRNRGAVPSFLGGGALRLGFAVLAVNGRRGGAVPGRVTLAVDDQVVAVLAGRGAQVRLGLVHSVVFVRASSSYSASAPSVPASSSAGTSSPGLSTSMIARFM